MVLAFAGMTGFFGHLQRLFTPRVVAVVLLLIAFTLTPTILKLVLYPQGTTPQVNMVYALAHNFLTLILHRFLAGIWKSVLIMISMVVGSVADSYLPGEPQHDMCSVFKIRPLFFTNMIGHLSFDVGILISFFVCFRGPVD